MLSGKIKRCLAFLMAILIVLSLLPIAVFAEDEEMLDYDYSTGAEVSSGNYVLDKEACDQSNHYIVNYQKEINRILELYLGRADISIEEMYNFVTQMGEKKISDARYDILVLAEDLQYALESGLITEQEGQKLVSTNPIICEFSDYIMDNVSERSSVSLFAETSGSYIPVTGVNVNVSGATDNSMTDGSITVTSKGSGGFLGLGASAKTTTITIYNESGSRATVSFNWTATSVNELKMDGTKYTGEKGSFSKLIEAGESVVITITTGKNSTVNKLVMEGFDLKEPKESSNVTFICNELGSITVGGEAVTSNDNIREIPLEGVEIKAVASSGAKFLGWIDAETHKLISTAATHTLTPPSDMMVEAVFVNSLSSAWFLVNTEYLYENLNAAATAAAGSRGTVVPINDGVLPAGDYEIPTGVTLVIPKDSSNVYYTDEHEPEISSSYSKPTPYRTFTMAEGAKIEVANGGMISVVSQYSASSQNVSSRNGTPSGPYGWIKMSSGSSIVLYNGATLYAHGFITGSGEIIAKSGATVYEFFQNLGWRGGSSSTEKVFEQYKVFPVAQYYVQNIEVPVTFESGAKELVKTCVTVSLIGEQKAETEFIGSNGLFRAAEGASIVKKYDPSTDRIIIDINGDTSLSSFSLSFFYGRYNFDTAKYVLPINSNFTININSGTTNADQDMALLPGVQITIAEGAIVTIPSGKSIYVYDRDEWIAGDYAYAGGKFNPVPYTPTKEYTRTEADLVDAVIDINGTIIINGSAYTTAGGASIISSEKTGHVQLVNGAGTGTVTYQVSGASTLNEIPITSLKLQHGDKTYLETTGATVNTDYYYCVSHDRWNKGVVNLSSVVTDPTCIEEGYTTHTCTCGFKYVDSIVAANGHTEAIDAAVVATCTEAGKTEGKHCEICSEVLIAQEEIPALGHQYVDDVCTRCGQAKPPMIQVGRTLNYEDMIYVVGIFELTGVDGVNLETDAGLLTWTQANYNAMLAANNNQVVFDATYADINPGLTAYKETGYFYGESDGIYTPSLHEQAYYAGYIKLADGTYVITEPQLYGPTVYAINMLADSDTRSETKELCVALLNYIAAAQEYFEKDTSNLANKVLTADQKAYDWTSVTDLKLATNNFGANNEKQVEANTTVFTKSGKNLLFNQMISIGALYKYGTNITVTVGDDSKAGAIFWTAAEWKALQAAPDINCTTGTRVALSNDYPEEGVYTALAPMIAPKNMMDAEYYFLGYIVQNNEVYYSGVECYTVEQYINNIVTKYNKGEKDEEGKVITEDGETITKEMVNLAQRLYYYERAARKALPGTK